MLTRKQERAFYDSHRNAPLAATDDDLYDHVRSGDAAADKSKLAKRKPGDPGVTQQQLMRFFDPKFAKKHDDSTEVRRAKLKVAQLIGFIGFLQHLPDIICTACLGRGTAYTIRQASASVPNFWHFDYSVRTSSRHDEEAAGRPRLCSRLLCRMERICHREAIRMDRRVRE